MIRITQQTVMAWLLAITFAGPALADEPQQQVRLPLKPDMIVNEADVGQPEGLIDEQDEIVGPPVGDPDSAWQINARHWGDAPFSAHIDLGEPRPLSTLWIYDTHGQGDLVISVGEPGDWRELLTYGCDKFKTWVPLQLDVRTRYVRLTRKDGGANFTEIAIYQHTPESWQRTVAHKKAEAEAEAERQAALQRAREEMKKRPLVDAGPPFGELHLIDEIDCATQAPDHAFVEDPEGASHVETILGKDARVLRKTEGEAVYISYRIGRMKLLQPGATYLLEVEYPEDAPRSMVIMNGGNETARGFHTGATVGDAMHPKYVNNLNESLQIPLSGEYKRWRMLFNLHDRTPDRTFIRGEGERELTAEDGFTVTIAQFSARNIPMSEGAAVSKIRLYAVPDASQYDAEYRLPPDDLPHRRLFWREEMADGVITSLEQDKRGLDNPIDWWRFKRNTMKFLGMNTYTKDLLEFGAVQHWDTTEGGGNDWAYHNHVHKAFWAQIVDVMGEAGLDILPYYEYAGSKGEQGLGNERRAKPLTRDDAYTHIQWIESANADITDPDTYDDFKKMLDLTIVRYADRAEFAGAWLRPRSQLPISFADATRQRFADEANDGAPVTRQQLIDDESLLEKYYDWWYGKRRAFLVAMRDHLRETGVNDDANIFFTNEASEPGVSFNSWDNVLVTDDVATWEQVLAHPEHRDGDDTITPISVDHVVEEQMYLEGLLAPALNWGDWEIHHANPAADPQRYQDVEGVLMSHAFNRLYTVADRETFNTFRGPAGLMLARHYSLNENMMFDTEDESKLGYFVADIERAGPYSMLAEAHAMANGDPTHIGYLVGSNFARGFPEYARKFNTAFLSLPALPSTLAEDASPDPDVVVRTIETEEHGTYLAVVNIGMTEKPAAEIHLPIRGRVTDAATGEPIEADDGTIRLSMYPCQLRAIHIE